MTATDPTGLLEEGEVCFTVKEAMVDSETGLPVGTILGDVIVSSCCRMVYWPAELPRLVGTLRSCRPI